MDSPTGPSDAELVSRCLAGRSDAWREFVARFRRPIWHIAYRFSATPEDADELTQDIFMRLLTVLPGYNPSGALGAWIRRVATNAGIDHYRKRARTPVTLPEEDAPEAPVPIWWSPESIAERREEAAIVRGLLDQLPPELAEPVMLRDLMDFDYPEIAERLGIPLGTVKSRIHRGRNALAKARRDVAARRAPAPGRPAVPPAGSSGAAGVGWRRNAG